MAIAKASGFQNSFVEPSLERADGLGRAHIASSQNSALFVLVLNRLGHTEEVMRSEDNRGGFPWFVGVPVHTTIWLLFIVIGTGP